MGESVLNLIIRLDDQASPGLGQVSGNVQQIGGASGPAIAGFTLLGQVAYDAGLSVVGAMGGALSAAGEFEAGVNNLGAIAGDSLAQAGFAFADVEAAALALGSSTAFSASQALDAMTELVKGGVPIADVMDQATEATLNLASAGQLELAGAAEIVAKQLGVWGETGLTATQTADLLAQAANASTVGVEDLALGLANVGGTAKVAGVDFDELVQTMALIAPGFSSAADAGTSLKTFIANLQPSTAPARTAMADLGLLSFNVADALEYLESEGVAPVGTSMNELASQIYQLQVAQGAGTEEAMKFAKSFETSVFYDAEGQFVGMEETARTLAASLEGLSEAEQVMALQTIFGSDAIRAAAAIANAGVPGFEGIAAAMTSAGTAADVAALQNQGFNFAMDSLMGSMETLQIVVGGALLPVLTGLINEALIPGVNAASTFAQALFGNQEALALLPGPIQVLVPLLQSASTILTTLGAALLEAGPFSLEFAEALGLVHPALQPIMLGLMELGTTLQAILIPALLTVVAPLADVGAAFGAVFTALGDPTSLDATATAVQALISAFGPEVAATILSLVGPFQGLMGQLQTFGGFLQANLVPVIATVAGAIAGSFVPGLLGAVGAAGGLSGVFASVGGVLAGLGGAFLAIAAPIAGVAVLAGTLATAWQNNFGGIRDATAQAMAAIGGAVQSGAALVGAILTQIQLFWQNNGTSILAFVQTTWTQLSTIIGGVVAIVMTIVNGLATFIGGVFQVIAGFISAHGGEIQAILTNAWNLISGIVTNTLGIIQGIVTTVLGVIQGDWGAAWAGIQQITDGVVGVLQTIFTDGLETIKGLFGLAVAAISDTLGGFVGTAKSLGGNIINGIVEGVKAGASALASAVQDAASRALDSAKRALGIQSPSTVAAAEVGLPISQGVALGVAQGAPEVAAAMQQIGAGALSAAASIPQDAIQLGQDAGAGLAAGLTGAASEASAAGADLAATFRDYFAVVVDDGDVLNDFLANLPASVQGAVGGVGQALAATTAASAEAGAALAATLSNYFAVVVDDGDLLNDFLTDLPASLQDAVQAIGEGLTGAAAGGQAAVADLAAGVAAAGGSISRTGGVIAGQVGQLGQQVVRDMAGALGQGGASIAAAAASWADGIGSALAVAPPAAVGVGQDAGAGLAEGLRAAMPAIEAAAAAVAQAPVKAMQAALQISSPSQLFADDVGSPITDGIAQGMLDGLDTLLDAAEQISWAVLEEAKVFAKTIQDAVGPLLAEALKGAADFARAQIGALDLLDSLTLPTLRIDPQIAIEQKAFDEAGKQLAAAEAQQRKLLESDPTAAIDKDLFKIEVDRNKLRTAMAQRQAKLETDFAKKRAKMEQDLAKDAGKDEAELARLAGRRAALEARARAGGNPERAAQAEEDLLELAEEEAEIRADLEAKRQEESAARKALAEEEAAARAELDAQRIEDETELNRLASERENLEIARRQAEKNHADALAAAEANRTYWFDQQHAAQERRRAAETAHAAAQARAQAEAQAIQDRAQAALVAAQRESLKLDNPAERGMFFDLRKKQIGEVAKLEQQLALATTDTERVRLQERLKLTQQAQQAEFAIYAQEAKERQAKQAAALRDAQAAIKQLGNLVFYSQEDVFGQGSNLIKGLAQGMASQAKTLSDTLGGILNQVLLDAKKQLGIKSPSAVAGKQIGMPFIAGIAQDVLAGQAALRDAATRAVGGLLVPAPALAGLARPAITPMPAGGLAGAMGLAAPLPASGDTYHINVNINGQPAPAEIRRLVEQSVQDGLRRAARDASIRQQR